MARPLLPYLLFFMMFAGASAGSEYNITSIVDDQAALIQFQEGWRTDLRIAGSVVLGLCFVVFLQIAAQWRFSGRIDGRIDCNITDGQVRRFFKASCYDGRRDKSCYKLIHDNIYPSTIYDEYYEDKIKPLWSWYKTKTPHSLEQLKERCNQALDLNRALRLFDLFLLVAGAICLGVSFTSNSTLLQVVSDDLAVSDAAELVLGVFRGHGDALPLNSHGATHMRNRSVEALKHVFGGSFGDQLTSRAQKIAALVPDALKERAVDLANGVQSASMPIDPWLKSRTVALLQDWRRLGKIHEGIVREIASNLSSVPEWRDHYKDLSIKSNLPSTVSTSFAAGYRIGKGIERL